jgi:hypothetical protein
LLNIIPSTIPPAKLSVALTRRENRKEGVLTGWTGDDEEETEDVPFTVAVVVGMVKPAVEVEQTGLATRLVRLGQAARAELSCELWAL